MATPATEPVAPRGQPWPRVVGIVALVVLGTCAAIASSTARPATSTTGSLASRTNWTLATALPVSTDFPSDWGYSLTGRLERTAPSPATSATPGQGPASEYAPQGCGKIPAILDHSGTVLAAFAHVDRYAQLFVQDAPPADAAATGENHEHGPNARFAIWVAPDAKDRIVNYLNWLSQCGEYRVTNHFLDGTVKNRRDVKTTIETRPANGADAALTLTRTFTPTAGRDPSSIYHIEYYAVRGVLLECTSYLEGAELEQVRRVTSQTLQRLRAL